MGAGDATGAMGAGMMAAGRTPAAPTGIGAVGGLHAFDGDAGGATAGTAAPARKRVSACPGNVVAIDAPITTVSDAHNCRRYRAKCQHSQTLLMPVVDRDLNQVRIGRDLFIRLGRQSRRCLEVPNRGQCAGQHDGDDRA